jgi:hypothetical protein
VCSSDLAEVYNLFIETSGRYDLLTDEDEPSARGLLYMQAAQRFLDREFAHPQEDAWLFKTLPANETTITFTQCRFVKGVYCENNAIAWQPLFHDVEAVSEDDDDLMHLPLKGIEVDPSESERSIMVRAAWFSPDITTDLDSRSFWTVQEPLLLVRAMQMQVEVDMRNTQGVNDYIVPLQHELKKIYFDLVAEEMAGPPDMWRVGV